MVNVDERNRLVNIVTLLADALILSNFLGFSFAVRSSGRLTLYVEIISWVIFIAALIAVNVWLYFVYYRKPRNQVRSESP